MQWTCIHLLTHTLSTCLSLSLAYPGHWDHQHGGSYWPHCGHPGQGGFHRDERSGHRRFVLCAVQVIQRRNRQGMSHPRQEVRSTGILFPPLCIYNELHHLGDHKMPIKSSFKWSLDMLLWPLLFWSPKGIVGFSNQTVHHKCLALRGTASLSARQQRAHTWPMFNISKWRVPLKAPQLGTEALFMRLSEMTRASRESVVNRVRTQGGNWIKYSNEVLISISPLGFELKNPAFTLAKQRRVLFGRPFNQQNCLLTV